MPVTQISKIQLRRGAQAELDSGTLADGEIGFATDTGRMFIGTDPLRGGPWTGRSVLPYGSVELLTEASIETFARLHDRLERVTGPVTMADGLTTRRSHLEAELARNVLTWIAVAALTFDNNGVRQNALENIILTTSSSLSATIHYTLLDGATVVRSGELTAVHDGNSSIDAAVMTDEYSLNMTTLSAAKPLLVADTFDAGVRFRVVRVGSSSSYTFRLQYQNALSKAYRFQFRIQVSAKPS